MFTEGTNNQLATSRNDWSWEQYQGGLATSRIALSTGFDRAVDIAKRRTLDGSCADACKKLPVMCKNLLTDLLAGN